MAVNKRVELTWNGDKYTVLVTMDIIERLEERINLATMARNLAEGDVKLSQTARLVASLLNEAGANVSVQEVFDGMFTGEGADGEAVMSMVGGILGAIFPAPKKKRQSSSKRSANKA